MTGGVLAALALAAVLVLPASPRRRLGGGSRAMGVRGRRTVWHLPAGATAVIGGVAVTRAMPVTVVMAAAVLGGTVALRHRRRSRRRRADTEGRALEGVLDVLVGELGVGAHPVRAFEVAAAETAHPTVSAGMLAVSARARLGADVPGGLRAVAERSALPAQWERLAVYWQLAVDHGLAIATLMRAAQRDIGERQRFAVRVEAAMAGARASAAILAGLPLLGVLLGQLMGAGSVAFLLSAAGGPLLLAGVTLACLGLVWSDRISAVGAKR